MTQNKKGRKPQASKPPQQPKKKPAPARAPRAIKPVEVEAPPALEGEQAPQNEVQQQEAPQRVHYEKQRTLTIPQGSRGGVQALLEKQARIQAQMDELNAQAKDTAAQLSGAYIALAGQVMKMSGKEAFRPVDAKTFEVWAPANEKKPGLAKRLLNAIKG